MICFQNCNWKKAPRQRHWSCSTMLVKEVVFPAIMTTQEDLANGGSPVWCIWIQIGKTVMEESLFCILSYSLRWWLLHFWAVRCCSEVMFCCTPSARRWPPGFVSPFGWTAPRQIAMKNATSQPRRWRLMRTMWSSWCTAHCSVQFHARSMQRNTKTRCWRVCLAHQDARKCWRGISSMWLNN